MIFVVQQQQQQLISSSPVAFLPSNDVVLPNVSI
jgi:hypothetical protein